MTQPTHTPPLPSLEGKTVLITGASSGLGSAVAIACGQAKATVILLSRNIAKLEAIYDEIEASGGPQPGIYPLDLEGATAKDYFDLQANLQREFGSLHGLVHCAASLGRPTPLANYPTDVWMKTFAINLHGPTLLTQACLPLLQESKQGSIIFTLDDRQNAYSGAYSSSKSAQATYMKVLAQETETDLNDQNKPNVIINGILPGKMRTPLRAAAYPGEDPFKNPAPSEYASTFVEILSRTTEHRSGDTVNLAINNPIT